MTASVPPFPSPPDGAHLSALEERRFWLGDVEIAQSLPVSGMVLLPGVPPWPQLVVNGPDWLEARASMEQGRRIRLESDQSVALLELWPELWRAPSAEGHATLLLAHRGLFRWLQGPAVLGVEEVLAAAMR